MSQELLQDEQELAAFLDVLRDEDAKSYLEVGAKFGGMFRRVAEIMPEGARLVAVDLPHGTRLWRESSAALTKAVMEMHACGLDAHVIWGDSTSSDVVEKVRALGPFDAIMIDANHTLPYVTRDWQNYGPMGRLVAFHDIAWRRAPEWVGVRIDVPQVWDSIKGDYRHQEFRFCTTGKNNGIGVLWRA